VTDSLHRSISPAHPFARALNVDARVGALIAATPPGNAVAIASKPVPGSTTLAWSAADPAASAAFRS
jgi:hypothetical protein